MRYVVLACLILALTMVGCAGKRAADSDGQTVLTPEMLVVKKEKAVVKQPVKLTEDDNRRAVRLTKGQRLVLELEENPSTGYKWQFRDDGLPDVVKLVDSKFEPYSTEPTRLGVGGKRFFTFEAVEYGNGLIKLVYCRPWQCELSTAKEFSVTVNVEQTETGESQPQGE